MSFSDVCPERAPRSLEAPGIVFEEPRRGPEQPSCHVDKQKSLAATVSIRICVPSRTLASLLSVTRSRLRKVQDTRVDVLCEPSWSRIHFDLVPHRVAFNRIVTHQASIRDQQGCPCFISANDAPYARRGYRMAVIAVAHPLCRDAPLGKGLRRRQTRRGGWAIRA